ncbi:hypothetical protein Tco_0404224 [Tanacetum coccineum]
MTEGIGGLKGTWLGMGFDQDVWILLFLACGLVVVTDGAQRKTAKGTKRTIDYFFKPKVDVVQGHESLPGDNNPEEDVRYTHPRDQQDVNDNHVNESPRVEREKMRITSTAVKLDS